MAKDEEAAPDWVARRITVKKSKVRSPDEQKKGGYLHETNEVKTSRYTWWNFVPKNLVEQFSIRSNIYFFLIGILQIIPSVSTTSGIPTQYIPLAFIIFVSGLRAATEDWGKHLADRKRNASKYEVLKGNVFEDIKSGDLRVGDIVKVRQDKMIPCDMLFLQSSLTQGHCFIDKANLNGETKLEVMTSLVQTRDVEIENLTITVYYEAPNGLFDSFRGQFKVEGEKDLVSVEKTSLLMRETTLRNCDYVYGLVLYCGDSTKIRVANSASSKPKLKQSSIMRAVERYLIFNLLFQVVVCLLAAIWCGVWMALNQDVWYLRWGDESIALAAVSVFFSWFILMSQMVPISLTVTAEMVKFAQSMFIGWDINLYDQTINQRAKCNTSTIHEDLGLINYIFSDKTGTLTQNKMEFRYALLPDTEYGSKETEIAKSVKARKRELKEKGQGNQHGQQQQQFDDKDPDSIGLSEKEKLTDSSSSSMSSKKNQRGAEYRAALLPNDHFESPRAKAADNRSPRAKDTKSPRATDAKSPRGKDKRTSSQDEDDRELRHPPHNKEDEDGEDDIVARKKKPWTELEAPYRSHGKSEPLTTCGGCCAPRGCCSLQGLCGCFVRRCWNRRVGVQEEDEQEESAEANQFTKEEKKELLTALWGGEGSEDDKKQLRTYMTNMALSNTVRPYEDEGELKFQAESAEELAMVQWARKCGFCKLSQNPTILEIKEGGGDEKGEKKVTKEKYNHVGTLGFTSKRSRVTVFYECVEGPLKGKLVVMSKGQDTVMLPLLQGLDDKQESDLMHNLQVCSANGLRTLLCAQGIQDMSWWKQRKGEYQEAVNNSGDPEKKDEVHKFYESMEKDAELEYVGCMGLEDQLQHLVPEAIRDFLSAKIKVWMITGDKLDAAKNIGIACNLIDPDMQPSFDAQDDIATCIDKFQHSRLVEVTGQWAGVAQDEEELSKLFYSLDTTKSGKLNPNELQTCLESLKLPLNEQAVAELFNADQKEIDLPAFIEFMSSVQMSAYDAVKADVEDGLLRYDAIEDHEAEPISTIVNRDAFLIMFPPAMMKHKKDKKDGKKDKKTDKDSKERGEKDDTDEKDTEGEDANSKDNVIDIKSKKPSKENREGKTQSKDSPKLQDSQGEGEEKEEESDEQEKTARQHKKDAKAKAKAENQKEEQHTEDKETEEEKKTKNSKREKKSGEAETPKEESGEEETDNEETPQAKSKEKTSEEEESESDATTKKDKKADEEDTGDNKKKSKKTKKNKKKKEKEEEEHHKKTTPAEDREEKKRRAKEEKEGKAAEEPTEKSEQGEGEGGKEESPEGKSKEESPEGKSEEENSGSKTEENPREKTGENSEPNKKEDNVGKKSQGKETTEKKTQDKTNEDRDAKPTEKSPKEVEESEEEEEDEGEEDSLTGRGKARGAQREKGGERDGNAKQREPNNQITTDWKEIILRPTQPNEPKQSNQETEKKEEIKAASKPKTANNTSSKKETREEKKETNKEEKAESPKKKKDRTKKQEEKIPEEKLEILREKFFKLAAVSKSVVFARAEPAMKKLMVTEVQKRQPKVVTLAIGDGANDTDMIMGAHVGVGIAGVEGSAASNASDYAIGSFRMLHTLVFVHGFWNYSRIASLVYIIFFKALLIAFAGYCFGFFSSFSGQQFFNEWSQIPYNVLYTALPIIALSVLDKPLSRNTLQNHPTLYASHRGAAFTRKQFFEWIARAAVYACIAFFIPILSLTGARVGTADMYWLSTTVLYLLVLIPTQVIVFDMNNVTFLHFCALLSSYVSFIALTFIFSFDVINNANLYMVVPKMWANGEVWFTVILGLSVPLLIELSFRSYFTLHFPTPVQVMKEKELMEKPSQKPVTSLARDSTVVNLLAEEENRRHGKEPRSPLVRDESKVGSDPEQLRKMVVRSMLRFRNLTGGQLESSSHDRYQKHDEAEASSPEGSPTRDEASGANTSKNSQYSGSEQNLRGQQKSF